MDNPRTPPSSEPIPEVAAAVERLKSLRREMELRFTGQFVENTICTLDQAAALLSAQAVMLEEARIQGARHEHERIINVLREAMLDEYGPGVAEQQDVWWWADQIEAQGPVITKLEASHDPSQ